MHLADAFIQSNYKLHDYTGYTYIFILFSLSVNYI